MHKHYTKSASLLYFKRIILRKSSDKSSAYQIHLHIPTRDVVFGRQIIFMCTTLRKYCVFYIDLCIYRIHICIIAYVHNVWHDDIIWLSIRSSCFDLLSHHNYYHHTMFICGTLLGRSPAFPTSDDFVRSNEIFRTKWPIY